MAIIVLLALLVLVVVGYLRSQPANQPVVQPADQPVVQAVVQSTVQPATIQEMVPPDCRYQEWTVCTYNPETDKNESYQVPLTVDSSCPKKTRICEPVTTSEWKQVPGTLKQVQMDDGVVCGVNAQDDIFCADKDIFSNPNWTQLPGKLKHVSVSNGKLYGVNSSDAIWYGESYKVPNWRQVPGALSQVDIDGNVVCGVNSSDMIYCADNDLRNPNWKQLPGALKHVAVNNGRLYGANRENQLFYSTNYKTPDWKRIPNQSFKQVDFDKNFVCGVAPNDMVYCADNDVSNPTWKQMPRDLKYISVNSSHLYGVNALNQPFTM